MENDFVTEGFKRGGEIFRSAAETATAYGSHLYDRVEGIVKEFIGREILNPLVKRVLKTGIQYRRMRFV